MAGAATLAGLPYRVNAPGALRLRSALALVFAAAFAAVIGTNYMLQLAVLRPNVAAGRLAAGGRGASAARGPLRSVPPARVPYFSGSPS